MAEKIINIPGLGKVKIMDLGKDAGQLFIVDGITASQVDKTSTYKVVDKDGNEKQFQVKGTGIQRYIYFSGKKYQLATAIDILLYVLCCIPIAVSVVVGNIPALPANGFYFVGGIIGGAIGGLMSGVAVYVVYKVKSPLIKALTIIGAIALTLLICWGVGTLIVKLQ